jgi:hypothetical protein
VPGTRYVPGDEYGYERDEAAPAELPGRRPRPGQDVIVTMGLAIGLLLMALQLWLLTLAFDLYLARKRGDTLSVAFFSGLVFLGGIVMLLLIERRPSR